MARPEARPAAKAGFAGSVVAVDVGAATFSLKEKGNVVGFDASKPILTGYRTLADMRIGDMVRVSYTATGIKVANLGGRRERAARKEGGAQTQPPQVQVREKPTKGVKKLLRRAKIGDGECFDDVDLKKNGKITPMELSIVIKDLTMEQFRKYDKKHRGYLDKGEFLDAVKNYQLRKGAIGALQPRAMGEAFSAQVRLPPRTALSRRAEPRIGPAQERERPAPSALPGNRRSPGRLRS